MIIKKAIAINAIAFSIFFQEMKLIFISLKSIFTLLKRDLVISAYRLYSLGGFPEKSAITA